MSFVKKIIFYIYFLQGFYRQVMKTPKSHQWYF